MSSTEVRCGRGALYGQYSVGVSRLVIVCVPVNFVHLSTIVSRYTSLNSSVFTCPMNP